MLVEMRFVIFQERHIGIINQKCSKRVSGTEIQGALSRETRAGTMVYNTVGSSSSYSIKSFAGCTAVPVPTTRIS